MKMEIRGNKIYVDGRRAKDLHPVRTKASDLSQSIKSSTINGIGDFGRGVGNSVGSLLYYVSWITGKVAIIATIIFGIMVGSYIIKNGIGIDVLHLKSFLLLAGSAGIGVISHIIMNATA